MVICYDGEAVAQYMKQAVEYSQERPVLVDHFLMDATEVDVDALCDSEDVIIAGIMQHIEEAGIHSGDSSCVLPAVNIRPETLDVLRTYTRKLALALKVVGLVNLQFAIQRDADGNDNVYVIEVNPRASRTIAVCDRSHRHSTRESRRTPYDRPQTHASFSPRSSPQARTSKRRILLRQNPPSSPGTNLLTSTPYSAPEMRSTGEVMGVAAAFGEAFAKAQLSAGHLLPTGGTGLLQRQRPRQRKQPSSFFRPPLRRFFYMNGNFFIDDPDAFNVTDTYLVEHAGERSSHSLAEAQASIALSAVAGGMYEIGDDLLVLDSEKRSTGVGGKPGNCSTWPKLAELLRPWT